MKLKINYDKIKYVAGSFTIPSKDIKTLYIIQDSVYNSLLFILEEVHYREYSKKEIFDLNYRM